MRTRLIVFTVLASMFLYACASSKKSSTPDEGPYIMTIDGKGVPTSEFVYVYSKNNSKSDGAFTDTSVRSYLDLYQNFKLKVHEAQALGLDTQPSFIKELETYRKQLARPYLTESSVTDSLVKEAYDRMKQEVKASHILIMSKPGDAPADTLEAYKKIKSLQSKLKKGASFEKLAAENSDDTYSAKNGGSLGYFTALNMVYPFESAAYETKEGEVSDIIKTQFGYHLVKVENKRPNSGKVEVAHIMIKANPGMPADDSLEAKNRVDEIYSKLQEGLKWEDAVLQYTEDPGTKTKGGVLPAFGINEFVKPFETAAFGLSKEGEITKPIQTPYGWHIIKLIEKKPIGDFESLKPEISQKVQRDSRSQIKDQMFYARLKKENDYAENEQNIAKVKTKADSTIFASPSLAPELEEKELFTIKGDPYTAASFYAYMSKFKAMNAQESFTPQTYFDYRFKDFVNLSLKEYEEEHLAEKYTDYRMLYREYRDGIMLFQLMDDMVWSKAVKDTTGLQEFFSEHEDDYVWGERVKAVIINAQDKQSMEEASKQMLEFQKSGTTLLVKPASDPITFAKRKYSIDMEKNVATLDRIIKQLKSDTTLKIELSPYYISGEKSYLGQKRLDTVINYLAANGISDKQLIKAEAQKGKKSIVDIQYIGSTLKHLERSFNAEKNSALALDIKEGVFEKKDKDYFTNGKVSWEKGNYSFEKDGRYFFVQVQEIQEPRNKKLSEIRGLVISDYQNYLEKEWIKELSEKYTIVINEEEVSGVIKKK